MPDATITSTASTFGTISGTFAADQSTVTGTVTGIVVGTLTGSVGVPGPQGPTGATGATGATGPAGPAGSPGVGVPVGGTAGQFLTKIDGTNYNTDWTTVNLSVYAVKANNLSDLSSASTARTNLGLGSLAVVNDAPSNGSQYARKNAAWDVVTTTPDFISSVSSPLSVTTGNLTIDLSPYLTSATAASTYAVIAAGQPVSGTTGQVLTKQSGANWDSIWTTIIPGDRYLTSSTTSNTVSNGNKTFTIGTGLSYTPTQNITISYDASNHMHGEVLTYNSGTGVLTVDINHHTGSGTYTAWVVNVGGVTPATSVAWGAITGTISAQSDLQGQLDLKANLAGATFTGLVGTVASTTATAGLNVPHATAAPTTPVNGDIWTTTTGLFMHQNGSTRQYVDIEGTQTISGAKTFSAASLTFGNSTTSGTINIGSGSVLNGSTRSINIGTNAAVGSTNNINIGSLTGTSTTTLRGETNGVTQTAGDNTTKLATTAFVTAAVPAFATFTTPGVNSTTTVVSPRVVMDYIMHPGRTEWMKFGSSGTSGTGSAVYGGNTSGLTARYTALYGPNTATAGYAMAVWDTADSGHGMYGFTRGVSYEQRAWNKGIWASGRGVVGGSNNTFNGDANTTVRVSVGGKSSITSGAISATEPGFGWLIPGMGNALQLQVSNQSTVTTVTSSFTPVARQVFDWKMFSDGTGNVTLWINDSVVATTTAGPSTATPESFNFYFEMVEQTVSTATRVLYNSLNPRVWWGV